MSGAATGAAAAAAARARERLRREEEDMTRYNSDDLEGWEFKIVRAGTRRFKNRLAVQALCEEEAQAGWEMLEKFDDQRIRFKRRIDNRSRDQHLSIDPYRTQVGMSEGGLAAVITAAILVLGGLGVLVALLFSE